MFIYLSLFTNKCKCVAFGKMAKNAMSVTVNYS